MKCFKIVQLMIGFYINLLNNQALDLEKRTMWRNLVFDTEQFQDTPFTALFTSRCAVVIMMSEPDPCVSLVG